MSKLEELSLNGESKEVRLGVAYAGMYQNRT